MCSVVHGLYAACNSKYEKAKSNILEGEILIRCENDVSVLQASCYACDTNIKRLGKNRCRFYAYATFFDDSFALSHYCDEQSMKFSPFQIFKS